MVGRRLVTQISSQNHNAVSPRAFSLSADYEHRLLHQATAARRSLLLPALSDRQSSPDLFTLSSLTTPPRLSTTCPRRTPASYARYHRASQRPTCRNTHTVTADLRQRNQPMPPARPNSFCFDQRVLLLKAFRPITTRTHLHYSLPGIQTVLPCRRPTTRRPRRHTNAFPELPCDRMSVY